MIISVVGEAISLPPHKKFFPPPIFADFGRSKPLPYGGKMLAPPNSNLHAHPKGVPICPKIKIPSPPVRRAPHPFKPSLWESSQKTMMPPRSRSALTSWPACWTPPAARSSPAWCRTSPPPTPVPSSARARCRSWPSCAATTQSVWWSSTATSPPSRSAIWRMISAAATVKWSFA